MPEKVMVYSEAFKMQVVDDLDRGRFGSPHEAARAYGIGGATTVPLWVRQHGKEHLLKKVVKVSKQGEPSEIKRLKDRVRRLEASLADAHMDSALDRAFFDMLCERTKTDAAAFKKNTMPRRWESVRVAWAPAECKCCPALFEGWYDCAELLQTKAGTPSPGR